MDALGARVSSLLSRTWWVLLLRGLAAIAFGILTWSWPGASLAALVLLFGAYALSDGALGVWAAVSTRREHEDWWVLLLWGLVGIGVGLITFMAPGITALAVQFYIAIWAIGTGIAEIVVAMRLRREIKGELWLVLAGIASIIFGVVLIARPGVGALAVLSLIAAYAVIFGIIMVVLAFEVRSVASRLAHA